MPIFDELADEASAHHERLDGRGYHRGLDRKGLSAAARVLAVADVTDALKADRPYRKGMPPDAVAQILADGRGAALCPDAVDAAIDVREGAGAITRLVAVDDLATRPPRPAIRGGWHLKCQPPPCVWLNGRSFGPTRT